VAELRPRPRTVNTPEDFVSGASEDVQNKQLVGKNAKHIDWGNEKEQCAFQLRLNARIRNKLHFIAQFTPACSMHSLIMDAVDEMIDKRVNELLKLGYLPKTKEK
jgi:hypothetical protein